MGFPEEGGEGLGKRIQKMSFPSRPVDPDDPKTLRRAPEMLEAHSLAAISRVLSSFVAGSFVAFGGSSFVLGESGIEVGLLFFFTRCSGNHTIVMAVCMTSGTRPSIFSNSVRFDPHC